MKRSYVFLALLPFVIIFMANKGGSQGGFTGSPGDKNTTCTKCHNGNANTINGWITSDIPVGGYNAGEKYSLTITANDAFASRFGFEITAEDQLNNKTGVFTITNSTETRLTNNSKAVTHTSSGVGPTGNQRIWNFAWTAPAENVGTISFYASVNAANGNGNTSGDVIYKTSMVVSPSITGIRDISDYLTLYPNPVKDNLFISINAKGLRLTLLLINSSGLIVKNFNIIQGVNCLDLSHFQRGIYFITIPELVDFKTRKIFLI
jgi:hypothetical protein